MLNGLANLLLATAALLATASALAQEDAAEPVPYGTIPVKSSAPASPEPVTAVQDEPAMLEPVVVVGEKIGRTLDQTAASVNVSSGRQLEDFGDDSVFDLMERVANVSAGIEGGFSIRGVSDTGAAGFSGGRPLISTYVDGIAIDTIGQGGAVLEVFDVDQVEILRGAQSTSQGRNALGGAIVMTTREPTESWDLRTRLRLAELGERQYAAAGGGPLGAGFSFRLVGDLQESDGFITNTSLHDPDWNAEQRRNLRARLAWRSLSFADLGVLLTVGSSSVDGNRTINVENDDELPAARRTAIDNIHGWAKRESSPAALRIDVPLADSFALTATTGYVDSKLRGLRDLDQTSADNGVGYQNDQGRSLSQELRVNLRDWNNFTGVAGLYVGRFKTDEDWRFRNTLIHVSEVLPVPVVGDLVDLRVDGNNISRDQADNMAAFAEFDWAPTEQLALTAGLRYDHERSETYTEYEILRADGYLTTGGSVDVLEQLLALLPGIDLLPVLGPVGLAPGTGGGQVAKAGYHALLPKLGMRYQFTPEFGVFINYVEGYRAGGADVISSTGELNVYEPEYTRTWETGFRVAFWRQRLNARFNVYHTDWSDQQVSLPDAGGIAYYTQNAADSRLFGAELENTLSLSRRWSAYLSLGYAHTRFSNYSNDGEDYSGNEFVNAPHFTGSVGSTWRSAAGWFASGSYSYAGASYAHPSNAENMHSESRRTLDARLGYEASHWAITAFARNLLDADYRSYRYHFEPGLSVPEPSSLAAYGEPRVLGVQLELRL